MILSCTNKSCYSNDEHLLNTEDDTVYCLSCNKSIALPNPTKSILKSMRQVVRKSKGALQFKCGSCDHTGRPEIKTQFGKTSIAVCAKCKEKLAIHPSFVEALKQIKTEDLND